MTELDSEPKITRNLSDEIDERRQFIRLKVRTELNQNWTELVSQLANVLEEFLGDAGRIPEALLVRHLLRHF